MKFSSDVAFATAFYSDFVQEQTIVGCFLEL